MRTRDDYTKTSNPMGELQTSAPASGDELVAVLPGPSTQYYLFIDGDGRACVYRASSVEGYTDRYNETSPAAASIRDPNAFPTTMRLAGGAQRDAVARDGLRQLENHSVAKQVADFWSKNG